MNRTGKPSHQRPALWMHILITLILMVALGQSQEAMAQSQWETHGNNINSANTGNVGIGITGPSHKLHVYGSGNMSAAVQSTTAAAELGVTSSAANSGSWTMGTGWNSIAMRNLYFYDNVAGAVRMAFDSSGNVGIGTTAPSSRLHIAGNNSAPGGYPILKLENTQTNGHSWWLYSGAWGVPGALGIYDDTAGSYRMFFDATGKVGIGTTTPDDPLDIELAAVEDDVAWSQRLAQTGSSVVGRLGVYRKSSDANSGLVLNGVVGINNNIDAGGNFNVFAGAASTTFDTATPLFRIQGNGNVGIGTTNPTVKLDVNGDTKVTGNFNATGIITGGTIEAKYQDVAEWVPATHALPAGTVVVLNPTKSNQVMASTQSYDTRVAGVISERPGLALGEAGKDKVLVATTGRVKVKVDATRSPIRIGDLLVTSDVVGVATKSEPLTIQGRPFHSPGTLIGKALEPLEKGVGEILVLLSLQ